MLATCAPRVVLHPHDSSMPHPALELNVAIRGGQSKSDRLLSLEYSLTGDVSRIRIPPRRPAARADGLWCHTCFEAFVAAGESPQYHELNFSPSGEWAVWRFDGYRAGMAPVAHMKDPPIVVCSGPDALVLRASVPLESMGISLTSPVRLGLAAVIEDEEGRLSYWALTHAAGKPDFHDRSTFLLEWPT